MGVAVTGSYLVALPQALIRTGPTPSFIRPRSNQTFHTSACLTLEISFPSNNLADTHDDYQQPHQTPPSLLSSASIFIILPFHRPRAPHRICSNLDIFVACPGPLT